MPNKPTNALVVRFRTVKPSDINYIRHTWYHSYPTHPLRKGVDQRRWAQIFREWLEKVTDRSSRVVVACLDQYDATVVGFLVGEPLEATSFCVHFAYVKRALRGRGLGTALVRFATWPTPPADLTFSTSYLPVPHKHRNTCKYDPFALFTVNTSTWEKSDEWKEYLRCIRWTVHTVDGDGAGGVDDTGSAIGEGGRVDRKLEIDLGDPSGTSG